MHIHAVPSDGEAKFWLKPTIELARNIGLSSSKMNQAERLVESREEKITLPGTTILGAEITNVSSHCVWILIDDEELALPYSDFPWFKAATIQQILNVLRPSSDHLYWPDLDVDLSVDSIRHPARFQLRAESTFQPRHSPEAPPSNP